MSFENTLVTPIPKDVLAVADFASRLSHRHRSNGGDTVNLFVAFVATFATLEPDLAAKCLVVVESAVDQGVH